MPLGRSRVSPRATRLPARRDREPASIRRTRACRLARPARRFRSASRTWSSLVLVIAPAHRDDDSAVKARFRRARDTARPLASRRPSVHHAARSRPASDPRCEPAYRSTASSSGDTRKPGPDPRPGRGSRHKRRRDLTQPAHPQLLNQAPDARAAKSTKPVCYRKHGYAAQDTPNKATVPTPRR